MRFVVKCRKIPSFCLVKRPLIIGISGCVVRENVIVFSSCVALVTQAALKEMQFPGLLAVGMPVAVGLAFRVLGYFTNRPLLGAEALAGYLMFATVTGMNVVC